MVKELLDPAVITTMEAKAEIEYRTLNSEYLTGKDVILAMAPIIDNAEQNYQILDKIDMTGREITQIDTFKSNVKTRSEKMALISNGRNTIQLLDWNEITTIVRHDPVVRVIGPDAFAIADVFCGNMLKMIETKIVDNFKLTADVTKDIAGLTGQTIEEVTSKLEERIVDFKTLLGDVFKYPERKTEEPNDPLLDSMR